MGNPKMARRGTSNPASKLNPDLVLQILVELSQGARQKDLAEKYKVHPSLISLVKWGRVWPEYGNDIREKFRQILEQKRKGKKR